MTCTIMGWIEEPYNLYYLSAGVAELGDALDSKSSEAKPLVRVRFPPPAHTSFCLPD